MGYQRPPKSDLHTRMEEDDKKDRDHEVSLDDDDLADGYCLVDASLVSVARHTCNT